MTHIFSWTYFVQFLKNSKYISIVIIFFMIVSLFVQMASMINQFLVVESNQSNFNGLTKKTRINELLVFKDFKLIFGIKGQEVESKKVLSDIPVTTLNVDLLGVLLNSSQVKDLNSSVILRIDNSERTYGVGDRLSNGAQVQEIHADYIVLNRNGQQEKVALVNVNNAKMINRSPEKSVFSRPSDFNGRSLFR